MEEIVFMSLAEILNLVFFKFGIQLFFPDQDRW